MITISTDENGGSLDCFNQTGENAISLMVSLDGSGVIERIPNNEDTSNPAISPTDLIKEN